MSRCVCSVAPMPEGKVCQLCGGTGIASAVGALTPQMLHTMLGELRSPHPEPRLYVHPWHPMAPTKRRRNYRWTRELTGRVFGSLEIKGHIGYKWVCECECGRCRRFWGKHLVSGIRRDCGCGISLQKEKRTHD